MMKMLTRRLHNLEARRNENPIVLPWLMVETRNETEYVDSITGEKYSGEQLELLKQKFRLIVVYLQDENILLQQDI